jgi:hypothetical protein
MKLDALHTLALQKTRTLKVTGDTYKAYYTILSITSKSSRPRHALDITAQDVKEKLQRFIDNPTVHAARKRIYSRYIGQLED